MKTVLGSTLSTEVKIEALRRFVHRFTREHRPAWVAIGREDGTPFPVQFSSDDDWLAHTYFHVTDSGRLSERNTSCEPHPTWPDNPELRKA